MTEPCIIIGVLDDGADGLAPAALEHIKTAHVVIGGTRVLTLFAPLLRPDAKTFDLTGKLAQVPAWITQARADHLKVVVLATGDPLCHGVAHYLIGKLGSEACVVLPNVSTLQLAFARLGWAWQDAHISSVHSKDAGEWSPGSTPEHGLYSLLQDVQRHALLGIFTSPENTPARIARMLLAERLDTDWCLSVAERLSQPDERVLRDLSIADAAQQTFAEPNIVMLRRTTTARSPVLFGLADESFEQRKPEKGLITKREVRAVSLARMQLHADSVVWDIGAGSGAVGLEAARLCPRGHVYAIEKNTDDAAIAARNRERLRLTNYSLLHAKAPQGMEAWPDPDVVFIGGSGGELEELIMLCLRRLKPDGWLVMNFVTLENQALALAALKACGAVWDVTMLQAARSQPILDMHRLAAENPVWIISAKKS